MSKSHRLRMLILAGMFASMGVVLKHFALTTYEFRFSFYDIPLFLGGMFLGPVFGLMIGFVVDWVYVLTSPWAFSFNFFTLSAMTWGLMGGLFFYLPKTLSVKKLAVIIVLTSLIAFSFNSWQLYIMQNTGMFAFLPFRIVSMILKWPLQVYALSIIYKRVMFASSLSLLKDSY